MSPFPLGILAAAGAAAGGSYELIESNILTSSASSVTFSSIPQDYKHLQIRMLSRVNEAGTGTRRIAMRINGISTNSYASHELFGNSSAVYSQSATSQSYLWAGYSPQNGITSGAFAPAVCDILDYSNTSKNTTTRALTGSPATQQLVDLQSGLFINTAAVTSLLIYTESTAAGFTSGSRFSLYGIRG